MVTARVDLNSLNNELNGFEKSLDEWAHRSVAGADSQKDRHLKQLREFQSVIRSLHHHQKDLERRAEEVKQQLKTEETQITELEEEFSKIQAEQAALPSLISEVHALLDAETRSAEADAAALAAREASQEKIVAGVRTALKMYHERLGLEFVNQSPDNTLEILFTQVDPANPSREFKLGVGVVNDDQYEVRKCDPPLKELPGLIDTLNATSNFSQFIREVRAAFQKLVSLDR